MEIIGIIIGALAIALGLVNWKLFLFREMHKVGPSATPIIAVVLFLFAGLMSKFWLFRDYVWLILFIDGAALPMFSYLAIRKFVGRIT